MLCHHIIFLQVTSGRSEFPTRSLRAPYSVNPLPSIHNQHRTDDYCHIRSDGCHRDTVSPKSSPQRSITLQETQCCMLFKNGSIITERFTEVNGLLDRQPPTNWLGSRGRACKGVPAVSLGNAFSFLRKQLDCIMELQPRGAELISPTPLCLHAGSWGE